MESSFIASLEVSGGGDGRGFVHALELNHIIYVRKRAKSFAANVLTKQDPSTAPIFKFYSALWKIKWYKSAGCKFMGSFVLQMQKPWIILKFHSDPSLHLNLKPKMHSFIVFFGFHGNVFSLPSRFTENNGKPTILNRNKFPCCNILCISFSSLNPQNAKAR